MLPKAPSCFHDLTYVTCNIFVGNINAVNASMHNNDYKRAPVVYLLHPGPVIKHFIFQQNSGYFVVTTDNLLCIFALQDARPLLQQQHGLLNMSEELSNPGDASSYWRKVTWNWRVGLLPGVNLGHMVDIFTVDMENFLKLFVNSQFWYSKPER